MAHNEVGASRARCGCRPIKRTVIDDHDFEIRTQNKRGQTFA
jgi:hypothetical protein